MAAVPKLVEYPVKPLMSEEVTHKVEPSSEKIKVVNAEEEFRKITQATPRDRSAEEAFIAGKVQMISTHPTLEPEERERLIESLLAGQPPELRSALSVAKRGPVPGGVGYGMFYNSPFKNAFTDGTAIYGEIITPNPPGGNVNTYLYLTATNRSAKGVEAFISYNGQNETFFKVFDWARPGDEWQTNVPFSALGNYLWQVQSHGFSFQVIYLMNVTRLGAPNSWWNQVLLWNRVSKNWDLIYQYNYSATLNDQQTGWVGSWGPIVETFQNSYAGTNPMGFLNTQLIRRNGSWGSWQLLSASDSYIRNDNKGFSQMFLDPNHTWAVRS